MEYVIKPASRFSLNLKELWDYRELFYFFTWRDIKVKYKQSILGFAWAILQPFVMMIIFSFFFGEILNVPSDGIPYPIFVYSGLLFWNVFAIGMSNSGNSMLANAGIIKKIYFPRLIIPMSAILVAVFDFFMALIVYIGLLIYFQFEVSVFKLCLLLPLSLLLTVISTFGLGVFLAALNVKYRDFKYIIPFLVQALLFLTPVIYPVSIIPQAWAKMILSLNPMVAPINLARVALIDKGVDFQLIALSIASGLVIFVIGVITFRKSEAYFADLA